MTTFVDENPRRSDNELQDILNRYCGDIGYVIRRLALAEKVIDAGKDLCRQPGHSRQKEPLAQALLSLGDTDFTPFDWTART